jgi:exodeoxyribonuclease VII large subunit
MITEKLSLSQLNQKIKASISASFPELLWIVAEISEIRLNSSGHCYLELIEKDEETDRVIAKIKATIWSFTYRMLAPYFETSTGYSLVAGLKVMVRVQPEFHELYGISLTIKDIDPSYTLGDLARVKREILRKLQSEGVIDMNRMLTFPLVPQRIAVISSETAAGYEDFMDTLIHNSKGFYFYTELFHAQVQGEKAAESIINALERIYEKEDEFDVVVIIRGGGSQSDLECFNNYNLVYHITQFPLPIVSGIGHERDETITDIVAHTSVKTPTAVAEFLVDTINDFENVLETYWEQLSQLALGILSDEKEKMLSLSQKTVYLVHENLNKESNQLVTSFKRLGLLRQQFYRRKYDILSGYSGRVGFDSGSLLKSKSSFLELTSVRLRRSIQFNMKQAKDRLLAIEKNLEYLSPENVLMRGYSISTSSGKLIKDAKHLKEGDELTTKFFKGGVLSIVKKSIKT